MSEQATEPCANLELVRSIYADWERGDFSSVGWAHPEIEFVFNGGPDPVNPTGLAGMVERFRDFLSAWEAYHIGAEEYRELDSERVLVLTRSRARGKMSGLELGQLGGTGANVFHIRDGKVIRLVLDWDRAHALAELWREGYEGWARGA